MDLQTYLMIKAAGTPVNRALKQMWKIRQRGAFYINGAGHTAAAMRAGATPAQYSNARAGTIRRYAPASDPIRGTIDPAGNTYPTFQRGLAAEMHGGNLAAADPRSIGLSEGALGRVMNDPNLRQQAAAQAPNLWYGRQFVY